MVIAKSALENFRNRKLKSYDWLKDVSRDELLDAIESLPGKVNFRLRPFHHQLVAFFLGAKLPNFLFMLDMGLGKTFISLALMEYYKSLEEVDKVLVVCPNQASVDTWEEETAKFTDLSFTQLMGSREHRESLIEIPSDIHCINYGGLMPMGGKRERNVKKKKEEVKLDAKRATSFASNYDMVIFDEIHNLKNQQSVTWKIANVLCKKINYRYGLTGTPFGRNPEDLWAQFNLIDRGETLGTTLGLFRESFFNKKKNKYAKSEFSFIYTFPKRNEKLLNKTLQHKSIVYDETECNNLPPKIEKRIPIRVPEEIRDYYNQIIEGAINSKGDSEELGNSFVRMRQLTAGFLNLKDEDGESCEFEMGVNPKIEALETIVDGLPKDAKMVIFHEFIYSSKMISDMLTRKKIGHVCLNSKSAEKKTAISDWKRKKSIQILVSNSKMGGTGNNFQQAKYQVYYESPVSPITRRQADKRVWRTGQTKTVFIYDLVMMNTVDERVLEFLQEGKSLRDAIMTSPKLLEDMKI